MNNYLLDFENVQTVAVKNFSNWKMVIYFSFYSEQCKNITENDDVYEIVFDMGMKARISANKAMKKVKRNGIAL